MKKPREIDCKRLCDSYETCTLTHCGRRKGSIGNSIKTVMLSEELATSTDYYFKVREYREIPGIKLVRKILS